VGGMLRRKRVGIRRHWPRKKKEGFLVVEIGEKKLKVMIRFLATTLT